MRYYNKKPKLKKAVLILGLLLNIGILFAFKYFDFLIQNINLVFKSDFSYFNLVLPLGISFFTFQQLSYVVDSYRGEVPDYGIVDYALFVTFFPQLIAGPIVLHSEMVPQFMNVKLKSFNVDNFCQGLYAFSFGLTKKVLIADTLGRFVTYGYSSIAELTSVQAVITIISYTLQIYFDFSGYCDMAVGIGKMFNINIPQNFNSPYKALNAVDFWKRWHITLTRFLTRYIYFPLGGNRKGKARTYLNILIVFLVSGFWHGAGYTFILWGFMHGLANAFCRFFKKPISKIPKFINWLVCFIFLNVTWVFFRASTVSDAVLLLKRVFAGGTALSSDMVWGLERNILNNLFYLLLGDKNTLVFIIFVIVIALLLSTLAKNTNQRMAVFKPKFTTFASSAVLMVLSILSLSGVSTFLYFNF